MGQRLSNLILLPLLIATMTAPEFVRFGLFSSLVAVAVPLLSMNLHFAIGRLYFDTKDINEHGSIFLSNLFTAIFSIILFSGFIITIIYIGNIPDPLAENNIPTQIIIVIAAISLVFMQAAGILARLQDNSFLFAAISISSGLGLIAGYVILSPFMSDNVLAAILSYIFAQFLASMLGLLPMVRLLRNGRFCTKAVRRALSYSSGTMVFVVSMWVVAQAGRWVGSVTLTPSEAVSYTLISYGIVVLGVLVNSYTEARRIPIFERFSEEKIDEALQIIWRSALKNIKIIAFFYTMGVIFCEYQTHILPNGYRIEFVWLLPSLVYSLTAVLFNSAFWMLTGLHRTVWLSVICVSAVAIYIPLLSCLSYKGVMGLLWTSALVMTLQSAAAFGVAYYLARRQKHIVRSIKGSKA